MSDLRVPSGNPVHAMPRRPLPVVPAFAPMRRPTMRVLVPYGQRFEEALAILRTAPALRPETAW